MKWSSSALEEDIDAVDKSCVVDVFWRERERDREGAAPRSGVVVGRREVGERVEGLP